MEMDTPEEERKEAAKNTRVRLASPRKQLERTIQKMTKLSDTPMKPEKLVDLLTTLAGLQVKLLDLDRDTKLDALIEEIKQLKSEQVAAENQRDAAMQRMLEHINGERLKNEAELKTLNSQIATLHVQNAELMKTNNALKSENSELTLQVPSLQLQNAELQLTIKTLESRTAEELYAEARAKANARLSATSF
jgi:hypothetical protein